MPELQLLRADHGPAILDFEITNRAYFAASITDRGDEFFEHFAERHEALLADQQAGHRACYVLVAEDGAVLGRFNLVFVGDGVAELGYRVAQQAAGRGVATATVRDLCRLAASQHGVTTLKAGTTKDNAASQRVLLNNGFTPAGPADPAELGGKPGTWYRRDVTAGPAEPRQKWSARDAEYFDRWYADMETSATKDAILARNLNLPRDLGSAGILHWDAVPEIARELRVPSGGLLLDLACGRGGYGIEVARRSRARLIGVDFSIVALERARAIAAQRLQAGQAEFRSGTLTDTGLPAASADGVMCTDSVQFAEPPVAALREIRRVLRTGGRLALTTWQAASAGDPRVPDRLRHLDLGADLRAAGFQDVVVEDRPAWRAAERGVWEEATATPNEDNDLALSSLQEEGKRSLEAFDALRRVVAYATAP